MGFPLRLCDSAVIGGFYSPQRRGDAEQTQSKTPEAGRVLKDWRSGRARDFGLRRLEIRDGIGIWCWRKDSAREFWKRSNCWRASRSSSSFSLCAFLCASATLRLLEASIHRKVAETQSKRRAKLQKPGGARKTGDPAARATSVCGGSKYVCANSGFSRIARRQ